MSHSFQAYTEFPEPYTSLEEAVQELTEQGKDLGHAPKSPRSGS